MTHSSSPEWAAPQADEKLLRQTLLEASDLAFTDPAGARRLIVPFRELLSELDLGDPHLEAGSLQLLGNLANNELDFVEADTYLSAALARARSAGLLEAQLEISADLLGALLNRDEVSRAGDLLDTAYLLADRAGSSARWCLRIREGFLRLRLGESGASLSCFAEAKKELPQLSVGSISARLAYYASLLEAGLGKLYLTGGEYARAVEAYRAVVDICQRFQLRTRITYHHLELGRALLLVADEAGAIEEFRKAIETAGEADRRARAAALANLGFYAYQEARWTEAAAFFDESEHHYRAAGGSVYGDLASVALWRAEMAGMRDQRDRELELLLESFDHARLADDAARLALVLERLATYHADSGDYREAYTLRIHFEDARRRVEAEQAARQLGELELRHELEQRRQEGELLRLRAARLQLKALRAQMNPHFIFNALNAIQEFITAQRPTEAATYLAQFARLMRQSLEYSEREAITLEEEVEFLRSYFTLNQALRYQQSFTFALTVDENLEEDLIELPAMLVQPYVENALEHGIRLVEQGHVAVHFAPHEEDEDRLVITIQDNGIGREAAGKMPRVTNGTSHKSMGTAITEHRLELLNRGGASTAVVFEDLAVDAQGRRGTRVRIELPIQWKA